MNFSTAQTAHTCTKKYKTITMEKLPLNDIPMLVSAINFLLRDHEFDTLDEICDHFHVDRKELEAKMASQGFEWSEEQKKFW